jgi:hypothetical protein
MSNKRETPEEQRERLRQEELKNNPTGTLNDTLNRAQSGMPDTTGMSLKEISVLILVLIVGYIVYKLFF